MPGENSTWICRDTIQNLSSAGQWSQGEGIKNAKMSFTFIIEKKQSTRDLSKCNSVAIDIHSIPIILVTINVLMIPRYEPEVSLTTSSINLKVIGIRLLENKLFSKRQIPEFYFDTFNREKHFNVSKPWDKKLTERSSFFLNLYLLWAMRCKTRIKKLFFLYSLGYF